MTTKLEQAARHLLIDIAAGNGTDKSLTALREALSEPEQRGEAVANYPCKIVEADFAENTVTVRMLTDSYKVSAGTKFLCDAAPQKREWVELAKEDKLALWKKWNMTAAQIDAVIAAFKEANE